jgi:predicted ATPase/DNA-binding CsgD family transcriptional regulator
MAAAQRALGNLPAPTTAFVGRRREMADVRRLLSSSRLVTLAGPGGVGKTRLAACVAAGLQRSFPDGVWLVDLAPLDDPALVTQTVATTVGIRDLSARWPVAVLSDHLADKHLLLVLDNCEHLIDACAVLAEALLEADADLRILATSRQPLGLPSEQTVVVPPLAAPDPNSLVSVEVIASYDAVQLFVDRATSVLPTFGLNESNAAAVATLCARLDGLPLAIELAVARLRALSPEQILERLDERFRLLTGGSRAAMPRQQTLRALVDWSYDLCSAAERSLWGRVSVFAGSFDLDAAENVCADGILPRDSVLDLITALVEKSVLIREERGSAARYRLLDTIREYGRERLVEQGYDRTLRRRHRDYYLALAERANAGWFSKDGPLWLDRMRLEHANVRAALDFCLSERSEVDRGLRLAATLWYGWRAMGLLSEGRRWLDRLLAVDADPTPTRAQALWVNGSLAVLQDDVASARPMLEESTHLARRFGDAAAAAYAAVFAGQVAMLGGDLVTAAGLLEQALAAHRAADDPFGAALALVRLSLVASARNDPDRAGQLAAEYIALCEAHGAQWLAAFGHFALAVELWRRGDVAGAVDQAHKTVQAHWDDNDAIGVAEGVEVLAWAAAADGKGERAARLLGALDKIWQTVGEPLFGLPHLVPHHEECKTRSRGLLGEQAFEAATRRGRALDLDAMVAYALDLPAAAPAEGVEAPSPLTRREQAVAELVARGLSNKEIASVLVIAPRTAETHVEHILAKLGFTSRAQIATWVATRNAH